MINTDFIMGMLLRYRLGEFSARTKIYHQSALLGDELLLGNPGVNRINLTYEGAEMVRAYELLAFDYTAEVTSFILSLILCSHMGVAEWNPAGHIALRT